MNRAPDVVPRPSEAEGSIRIRLDIAYDGTNFAGWAIQPGFRTVQGELQAGLASILKRYPPGPWVHVAGRTDAGVHALGQVAHVDLSPEQADGLVRPRQGIGVRPATLELAAELHHRLRGILTNRPDIYVVSARRAAPGFDARYSALWRRYEYRIADRLALHDPLQRYRTTWYPHELDVDAMDAAAASLVGLHDFAAYCKRRPGATTIRTLQQFGWRRDADGVLVAVVKADAFCHSMVRSLVGACVAVGEGKLDPARLIDLRFEQERPSGDFNVMAPHGLSLLQVGYPEDAELAMRAVETRARRVHPDAFPG